MKEVRKLKGLQSQLKLLEGDAEALLIEVSTKQREYNQKVQAVKKIREEIKSIDVDKTIKVSEHAIVRYFERVKGYNISDIEKEILSQEVVSMAEKLGGNGSYPNTGGFKVLMKNFTVTTIIEK